MTTNERLKIHNNTVYAKNLLMTSILTLKDIKKLYINVDDDFKDLLNDLQFIINNLKT